MARSAFILLPVLGTFSAVGQSPDTTGMNTLIVYGDGFSFSVKEPDSWTGDIDKAAAYHANIIFYPAGEDPEQAALVQVAVFHKQDEKTQDDLAFDVKSYEERYPDLQQEDFHAAHKEYRVFAKLVFLKKDFFQYIAYVNPGARYGDGFSVAMNIRKRRANEEELKAFRGIIASLWMMGLK